MKTLPHNTSPLWHVLGLGAIGGLFACRLQNAGIPVASCASATLQDKSHVTLTLEEDNTLRQHDISVDDRGPIERLLLTTKAQQSEAAIKAIAHRFQPGAIVVVLQNGMGVHSMLSDQFPDLQILAATTTEGANRPTPDHIRHAGHGTTWIGPWQAKDLDAALQVATEWQNAGLPLEFDADIARRLWEKLVMNCAINPLTALLDCRNGELVRHDETRRVMHRIVKEVMELMQFYGISANEESLQEKVLAVAERTGANISSMLQDQRAGRTTEIAYINGFVATMAARAGKPAKLNQWLTDQVQQRQRHTPASLAQCLAQVTALDLVK